ncbi:tetratricopeptide repeat protein 30 homolog [Condylostylus longicornis]|uniref:tetratricopeptide repeat protein 30 homolog n=1 Tax=Condylostylus longicornis TaxID=2530218 RepID=UPI00244E06ED|nr:tetratricopeptide repeat protein 30 homolog [Condylostylus longicornis]
MFEISRKGGITKTIYSLIKEKRFEDVVEILSNFKDIQTSRAGLSILAHSYYNLQKFIDAANCYEILCDLAPKEEKYKFYYAQSLYQAGIFEESLKILKQITSDELKQQVLQLQSTIQYSEEEYSMCQATLGQRPQDSSDTANDEGCLLYQAEIYDGALKKFHSALQMGGFNPLIAYNIALCHYRMKQKAQSMNYISDIMERAIRNYPELGIGSQHVLETNDTRGNINLTTLSLSALTQALNLKAAIEYQDENVEGAREALLDMPPRMESELDPITLHNMALTDPEGPGAGLKRLAFLLELGPSVCPKEALGNILLLCCKHEMYDTAADILAENAHLTYKFLSQYLYDLLDALITAQTSTENAEKKLGTLASGLAAKLRTLAAQVQEARGNTDQNVLRNALKEYEEILERNYLPVVLARAWLYWREDDFIGAEKEFRTSAEFCSENQIWRLHAAHVLFMQGDKYKEAAAFYEPIVRQYSHEIINVSAAVLANLCVSYIMTFQNEEAEELMRKVEKAEEAKGNAEKQLLHLCIVNLVVGTLYCSKSNFEFGLSRIAHALEGGSGPRLCADTWIHVKRCVLGLLTGMAKQIIVLPYPAIQEILTFLHSCEIQGLLTPSSIPIIPHDFDNEIPTIGMEARKLRVILKKLVEYEK